MSGTAEASYYFHEGTATEAYRFLGAHGERTEGGYCYTFRVWAPNADEVTLLSDFGGWEQGIPMHRTSDPEIFEAIISSEKSYLGSAYKFRITRNGRSICKGDPYAFSSRGGSDGASILTDIPAYPWRDGDYMRMRNAVFGGDELSVPINIYEVHPGSFFRHPSGEYLTYAELADALLAYAKYMGYTHIELMPLTEYPYDASWGYQVCGYFAPTKRFGTPEDFCAFVDRLHAGGVGVILDWVPAHFPKDEWGLYEFDGGPLYEYSAEWRRESRSWGTRYFDLGKREVRSFLISSALFWLREYHIDGLRVDAVASMLYLDYDRGVGEWEPNADGTNISTEAEEFFRALSSAVSAYVPDALLIAEESTAYPGVTASVKEGGLGFRLKWNMGFSNDLFAYLSANDRERTQLHSALTFPITYAFSERYVLPVSHDEVVHGKRSLLQKMCGGDREKLATYRTALLLMMTFPGKKLLFMGSEYGQIGEWDFDNSLAWHQVKEGDHDALREYIAALNRLYLESPALYEQDFCEEGFCWLLADGAERRTVAYLRRSKAGEELIVAVCFSGAATPPLRIALPRSGRYRTLFSTGESGNAAEYSTVGAENLLTLPLSPLSGVILARRSDTVTL